MWSKVPNTHSVMLFKTKRGEMVDWQEMDGVCLDGVSRSQPSKRWMGYAWMGWAEVSPARDGWGMLGWGEQKSAQQEMNEVCMDGVSRSQPSKRWMGYAWMGWAEVSPARDGWGMHGWGEQKSAQQEMDGVCMDGVSRSQPNKSSEVIKIGINYNWQHYFLLCCHRVSANYSCPVMVLADLHASIKFWMVHAEVSPPCVQFEWYCIHWEKLMDSRSCLVGVPLKVPFKKCQCWTGFPQNALPFWGRNVYLLSHVPFSTECSALLRQECLPPLFPPIFHRMLCSSEAGMFTSSLSSHFLQNALP